MNTTRITIAFLMSMMLAASSAVGPAGATTVPGVTRAPWHGLAEGHAFALLTCSDGHFDSETGSACEVVATWGGKWPQSMWLNGRPLHARAEQASSCQVLLGTTAELTQQRHETREPELFELVPKAAVAELRRFMDAAVAAHADSSLRDVERSRRYWEAMADAVEADVLVLVRLYELDLLRSVSPWGTPPDSLAAWVDLALDERHPASSVEGLRRRHAAYRVVLGEAVQRPTEANQAELARWLLADDWIAVRFLTNYSPKRMPAGQSIRDALEHLSVNADDSEMRAAAEAALSRVDASRTGSRFRR